MRSSEDDYQEIVRKPRLERLSKMSNQQLADVVKESPLGWKQEDALSILVERLEAASARMTLC